jgi:hypothetical protein
LLLSVTAADSMADGGQVGEERAAADPALLRGA